MQRNLLCCLFWLEKSQLNSCKYYPCWLSHPPILPCSHPPGEQWFSNGDSSSSPGIFCQCLGTFLVVTTGVVLRMMLNMLQCIGQPIKNYLAPNDNNVMGGCFVHCGMFSSTPGFYQLNTSSTFYPLTLQVMRTRNVSRHHQMSPEGAKLPLLRTSALKGYHYLNFIFVICVCVLFYPK